MMTGQRTVENIQGYCALCISRRGSIARAPRPSIRLRVPGVLCAEEALRSLRRKG